jgi:hypothetical protein
VWDSGFGGKEEEKKECIKGMGIRYNAHCAIDVMEFFKGKKKNV